MLGQPLLNLWMFVRGVVIGYQMQRFVLGRLAVDLFERLRPLNVTMTLLAMTEDLTIQNVECGKQGGGAIALVKFRLLISIGLAE